MTINKLTGNIQPLDEVDKINEIIDGKQDTLVSGTNIKTINSNSILGSGNLQLDGLPSQTGKAGKFLQTDGTDASWESAPFRNIGEIVSSTIPLTDAGLHLLDGALIQGSGIYSDFVDYIADLYTDNPNANYFAQETIVESTFIRPNISSAGTMGGNSFAIQASSQYSSTYAAWKACNGVSSSVENGWVAASSGNQYYTFYNPTAIKVTKLTIQNGDGSERAIRQWEVQGSDDNSNWTSLASGTNSNTASYATWNINLSSNTNYYKYYKIKAITDSGLASICELGITATYISDVLTPEEAWQTAVTTYGVCGKFVYDSTANTVRLPKYNLKIYTGGGTAPVVGNGQQPHLHNQGGSDCPLRSTNNDGVRQAGTLYLSGVNSYSDAYFTTDPTKSGIIAQLSDITTSLDGYYYIVIATSTKTDIQVDIDEVVTDLNGKADVDLTNCTKPHIVETYVNGTSWYRVYSDGWCEQGGRAYISSSGVISLLKNYANTNYSISCTTDQQSPAYASQLAVSNFSVGIVTQGIAWGTGNVYWQACGYIR